ncbi:MAG: VOC family protein [Cytophagaceae bacterium]|nr:VOC family protein [Cytophagaceae bacterium]|tara:strand:- start:9776 stop:10195 length:420 start_codon:yes stop_codon:yes gene_type:complete
MAELHPHINFNGNAEEAFIFYKSVFGGDFSKTIRFKDVASEAFPIAEQEAEKLMHIALPIGNTQLMGNDVPEHMGRTNEEENRSKIFITAASKPEAEKLFNGLSTGGQVEVPLAEGSSGAYFAMFRDKYGIEWMISYEP